MPRTKKSSGRKKSSGCKYGKGASKSVESAMCAEKRAELCALVGAERAAR